MSRRCFVLLIVILGNLLANAVPTTVVRLGDRAFDVHRIHIKKGTWSERHSHRGMVLVMTNARAYFEEDQSAAGTFFLRENQLRVKNQDTAHRLGAADGDMDVVEIELDVPSERLQPRAHKDSRIFIAGMKVERLPGSGMCVELSTETESSTVCAESGRKE